MPPSKDSLTAVNWNQDGTFDLNITDGSRPYSAIPTVALSLRQIMGDGYTVIEQQTSGDGAVNAAGAHGYTYAASGFTGFVVNPTSLTFGDMGQVTGCSAVNWNQDRDAIRLPAIVAGEMGSRFHRGSTLTGILGDLRGELQR